MLVPFIISEFCTIEYAIWYSPNETPEAVQQEIEEYINLVCQLDPWLKANPPVVEWKLNWPASIVDVNHPITLAMAAAHREAAQGQTTFDPEPSVQGFAAVMDGTFLNIEGTPAIAYGPGNLLVAHAVNEYVDIDEVVMAARAYALLAMDWCGVDE